MTQMTCAVTEGTLLMEQSECECEQDATHDAQSADAGCDAVAAAEGCSSSSSSFLPPLLKCWWWVWWVMTLHYQLPHYCFLPHCHHLRCCRFLPHHGQRGVSEVSEVSVVSVVVRKQEAAGAQSEGAQGRRLCQWHQHQHQSLPPQPALPFASWPAWPSCAWSWVTQAEAPPETLPSWLKTKRS